jgi:hypothetical protein
MAEPSVGTQFDLYIDFEKSEGSASRVFHASAGLIDAFTKFDVALSGMVSIDIQSALVLDDVQGGSIRSKLRNVIFDIPDDALRDGEWRKILGHFLIKGKYVLCKWLEDNPKIDSIEQVKQVHDLLFIAAEETHALRLPFYRPIAFDDLLEATKRIDAATRHLLPSDSVKFLSIAGDATLQNEPHLGVDAATDILIERIDRVERTDQFKVKKPDFLGKSQWSIKIDGLSQYADFEDLTWLTRFQAGDEVLVPGDSLLAKLVMDVFYDYNGKEVRREYKIVEVIDIVERPIAHQAQLDLD